MRDICGMQRKDATIRRPASRRAELGQSMPRAFTARCRDRFQRDRRRGYLARLADGAPTPWQASTIASLVGLEWSALEAEARIGDMAAGREAREHRRLFQRLLADFERSLAPPAAKPPTLADLKREVFSARDQTAAA
jgi:hypothetical protein